MVDETNATDGFRPVRPVRPAAAYIGGKRALGERLARLIESIPHATYAEPFIGMGGVFLRRQTAPKAEVINDISADVATFFRVLQRHWQPFMDLLNWRFTSRAEFERLLATPADTLTDLERAVRFLYLQRLAFGGKVKGRSFGVSPSTPARFDTGKLTPVLAELHERLTGVVIERLPGVVIERLPYADFIARYDTPGTLFYLDPPYAGSEDDYGDGVFTPRDFEHLAGQLSGISGMFILSINDTPAIRAAFGGFEMEEVQLTYTINGAAMQEARELIITPPGLRDRICRAPTFL